MGADAHLLHAAVKLVQVAHKGLDQAMPAKLAGIVKTHAAMGVAAAWIPIPGADFAAGAAAIWGMYYRINEYLKLPFSENVVKSVASGVGTNLAAYCAALAVGDALKWFPGLGSLAGALVMSAAAYALTLASGYVYMQALTLLLQEKKADDITESDWGSAVNQVMSDRESVRSIINEARTSYRE
jgi:uncharacterized protein (DUF697 family)